VKPNTPVPNKILVRLTRVLMLHSSRFLGPAFHLGRKVYRVEFECTSSAYSRCTSALATLGGKAAFR
jgi:hypothetical protein